jgi:hypothetical protein
MVCTIYGVELDGKIIRNGEEIMIPKKVALSYFKVLSQHSPKYVLESHSNPGYE